MRNPRTTPRALSIGLAVPLGLILSGLLAATAFGHNVQTVSGYVDCQGVYHVTVHADVWDPTTLLVRIDGDVIYNQATGSSDHNQRDILFTGTGYSVGDSLFAKVNESGAFEASGSLTADDVICQTPSATPVATPVAGHDVQAVSGTVDCQGNYSITVTTDVSDPIHLVVLLDSARIYDQATGSSDNAERNIVITGTGASDNQAIFAATSESTGWESGALILNKQCQAPSPSPKPSHKPTPPTTTLPVDGGGAPILLLALALGVSALVFAGTLRRRSFDVK